MIVRGLLGRVQAGGIPPAQHLLPSLSGNRLALRLENLVRVRPLFVLSLEATTRLQTAASRPHLIAVRDLLPDALRSVSRQQIASRRCQQAIHQTLVGVRIGVRLEGRGLPGGRRQAGQVEGKAPDQCAAIGLRSRRPSGGFQAGEDETVERRAAPSSVGHHRNRRLAHRLESPVRFGGDPEVHPAEKPEDNPAKACGPPQGHAETGTGCGNGLHRAKCR